MNGMKQTPARVAWILLVLLAASVADGTDGNNATNAPAAKPEPLPVTSRDFFNAGTRRLREGKLREAEASLQAALAKQDERVQPISLYNLGHVRFEQGVEELKKSLAAGPVATRARTANQRGDQAIQVAADALAGNDVQKMVTAYLNGRGARRELRAANDAVRKALEIHGAALRKWQRSLGDFQSAAELKPSDTNAQHNAEIVERAIAKLIDSIREMQQAMMGMGERSQELGEQLKQLRGQIPAPLMPPGAAGDDEEEGRPWQPKEGEQEGPSRDGEEISLSPEEAGWLLEGFRLDGERRLPMGQGEQGQPRERSGRNW
jgi:tetratricopeptide (TPR) repeat protein